MPHSAARIFFIHTITKELIEQLPSYCPILSINAILHLRSLYLPLYQSGILEFFKVLRYGSLRYRQLLMYIAKVTRIPFCQEVEYRYPSRMSQSLCKSCYLLLTDCIIFLFFHNSLLFFAKLRTIFYLRKQLSSIFTPYPYTTLDPSHLI